MIVVPYTSLHRENVEALPEALFVRVENPDGYRQLLQRLWKRGEAFTLVEHDVVPTGAQLAQLDACPHAWCGFSYLPGDWTPVFGCIRFRASLINALPDVWENDWSWMQLDGLFADYARQRGHRHHWHYPHVRHTRIPHVDEGGEQRIPLPLAERARLIERERERLAASRRNTIGS